MENQFAKDIEAGLSNSPKYLSSKYFYDEQGDKLFQQIMKLDEYYPTNAEFEILKMEREKILKLIKQQFGDSSFQIIEFGAGDGFKTKLLLEHLVEEKVDFQYRPVDISGAVLDELKESLKKKWPQLDCRPLGGTYMNSLRELDSNQPKLLLFLGSNLGNFLKAAAADFIKQIHDRLQTNDLILFGIDLKKDPKTILNAYNDRQGVTRAFNLNLLKRINRELGANFQIEHFDHYPTYDPISGVCKSYLISKSNQKVKIEKLGKEFSFESAEAIQTEVSIKYSITELEALFKGAGFEHLEHLYDCKHYFVDTIWRRNEYESNLERQDNR